MNSKKTASFDVMGFMRKPSGVAIIALIIAMVLWGAWTLWAGHVFIPLS